MQIKKNRIWLIVAGVVVAFTVAAITTGILWYQSGLQPADAADKKEVRVDIKQGMSAGEVGRSLEEKGVIRSAQVMSIYLRLNGGASGFKTGVYVVSASQSLAEIIKHLSSGKTDEFSITFYPGAMLERVDKDSVAAKYDVRTTLSSAGYSDEEITEAFAAEYQSPVFAGRPGGAGLEGYLYGDTYFVQTGATAKQVVQRAIDEMARVVTENNLENKFASQGLTLYQGITLASIVERESIGCPGKSVCEDQREIASVFYNRLNINMMLGSDVTYHYAADKLGVERNYLLDSPYNTRINTGLPPGPIAVPGLSALNAVADPQKTDYLFFLSGDDDVTYFGKTEAEHNNNIRNHCQQKCLLP